MRLYRQHDMDLVGLYRTEGFKFQKQVKAALKAHARNEEYRIEQPKSPKIKEGYVPKTVLMHIYLDNTNDIEAITVLKTIRVGYRNAFLKAIVRKYLDTEPLDAYKQRNDLIFNAEEDYLEKPEKQEKTANSKEKEKKKTLENNVQNPEAMNDTVKTSVTARHDTGSDIEQIFTEPEQQSSLFDENNDDDELAKLLAEMNTLAH